MVGLRPICLHGKMWLTNQRPNEVGNRKRDGVGNQKLDGAENRQRGGTGNRESDGTGDGTVPEQVGDGIEDGTGDGTKRAETRWIGWAAIEMDG